MMITWRRTLTWGALRGFCFIPSKILSSTYPRREKMREEWRRKMWKDERETSSYIYINIQYISLHWIKAAVNHQILQLLWAPWCHVFSSFTRLRDVGSSSCVPLVQFVFLPARCSIENITEISPLFDFTRSPEKRNNNNKRRDETLAAALQVSQDRIGWFPSSVSHERWTQSKSVLFQKLCDITRLKRAAALTRRETREATRCLMHSSNTTRIKQSASMFPKGIFAEK